MGRDGRQPPHRKPAGRQPIRTTLHSLATLDTVTDGIGRALGRGEQVYWVCPMVSESELTDLAAAEARYATLRARFGDQVGLAHGQQDGPVRDAALAAFSAGRTRLLVATTVIEVGVDVPGASVMVVEHADRFGLAQLHQLRGRVGRGAAQSYCLLLHEDGLTETGRRRMLTCCATPRTASSSPTRISACAAAATCSASANPASPDSASRTRKRRTACSAWPTRTPPCCSSATRSSKPSGAGRPASSSACSTAVPPSKRWEPADKPAPSWQGVCSDVTRTHQPAWSTASGFAMLPALARRRDGACLILKRLGPPN